MTECHVPAKRFATEYASAPERAPGLPARDAHRLTLQTKLTEFGIPPTPEDRGALRQLAELDEGSIDAVVRWLTCAATTAATARAARAAVAAQYPSEPEPVRQPVTEPCAATERRPVAEQWPVSGPWPVAGRHPVPDPAPGTDPRLVAW